MERIIKFRGQKWDADLNRLDFVYGYLCDRNVIEDKLGVTHVVWGDSVGQFTGLKDKNGVDIYEGDKVRILYTDWMSKSDNDSRTLEQYLIDISKIGIVVFKDNGWNIEFYSDKFNEHFLGSIEYGKYGFLEIIGNIHETK